MVGQLAYKPSERQIALLRSTVGCWQCWLFSGPAVEHAAASPENAQPQSIAKAWRVHTIASTTETPIMMTPPSTAPLALLR